jgi:hypothetical protein
VPKVDFLASQLLPCRYRDIIERCRRALLRGSPSATAIEIERAQEEAEREKRFY